MIEKKSGELLFDRVHPYRVQLNLCRQYRWTFQFLRGGVVLSFEKNKKFNDNVEPGSESAVYH